MLMTQRQALRTSAGPESYQPDMYRRYAELLIEAGLLTRREVELALREARRAQQPLSLWLIRQHRIPSRYLPALRRLETLLARHGGSVRLAELLVGTGEFTRRELRRLVAQQERSGLCLGDLLIQHGWPNNRHAVRQRSLAAPLSTAAMLAVVSVGTWAMTHAHFYSMAPGSVTSQVRSTTHGLYPSSSVIDLRFASLGDIKPHLQRLRARPGPYRKPRGLAGTTRQKINKLRPYVNQYAKQYSLPPELILAVIEQESSFNPLAISPKNGVGLMQLVPQEGGRAAYHFSERKSGTPSLQELQDPKTNIRLGTAYLRLLLDKHFDDIHDEDVRVAVTLAAYNWGPTRMRKLMQKAGVPDTLDEVEALLNQHAPIETQNYVREITDRMEALG